MAFSQNNNRGRQNFSEINITPLTDVFLVLLVIMFLIAPLLDNQASLKINPPSSTSSSASGTPDKTKSILIEINKEGDIAINGTVEIKAGESGELVSEKIYNKIAELSTSMTDASSGEKPKVKLKADTDSTHGRVVFVYDAVSRAKLENKVGQLVLLTVKPNK